MSGYPNPFETRGFWRDALAWREAVTSKILPTTLFFGIYAAVIAGLHQALRWRGIETTQLGYTAGILALLLVLRTNSGYERWWEARKLWGGIVNQSRNLAIKGLEYGSDDPSWRDRFVRWSAAFSHVAKRSLRGQRSAPELERLLGPREAQLLLRAEHMPSYVARRLASLLAQARRERSWSALGSGEDDGFAFIEIDRERATLIDHIGGCERILKTPHARIHSIKLRRFILLYLLGLPLAIADSSIALMSVVTVLVAYPLLAIDQIGHELENPFDEHRASHLPLTSICETIEGNLLAFLEADRAPDDTQLERSLETGGSPATDEGDPSGNDQRSAYRT